MWRSHWPVSMPRRSEESSRPWLHDSAFSVQVAVPQRRAPQGAKLLEAERPHAVDLGLERFEVDWPASHARHAALRPDLPLLLVAGLPAAMR
jgi:hypothetical protein